MNYRRSVLCMTIFVLLAAIATPQTTKTSRSTTIAPASTGQLGTQAVVETTGPAGTSRTTTTPFETRHPRYRIRNGDVFTVTFPHVPAFNQTLTVQPDGYVTLQIVGDLYVQNLTVPELTDALVSAYGKTLREPAITIELKDFEKPYFMATGEVGHPGKYDLRGTTTVAQAIAIAGGFTADAKHSQVLLFRTTAEDWTEVREINLKNMLAKKNLEEDLLLQPGDLLFIPKSALSKLRLFTPRLTIGPSVRPF